MSSLEENNKNDLTKKAGNYVAPSKEARIRWITRAWSQITSDTIRNEFNIYRNVEPEDFVGFEPLSPKPFCEGSPKDEINNHNKQSIPVRKIENDLEHLRIAFNSDNGPELEDLVKDDGFFYESSISEKEYSDLQCDDLNILDELEELNDAEDTNEHEHEEEEGENEEGLLHVPSSN